MKNKNYLTGNIICAIPQLKDIFFSKSIIYITHHNKNGAVGIVLNYKLMKIKSSDIIKKLNLDIKNTSNNFSIHIGGPMNQENGFILHSQEYFEPNTIKITKDINLTCTRKIFEDIAMNKGPKKYFISLGYAGWGPGQLEDELIKNSWIHITEKLDLIFDIDARDKWDKAIKLSGIDFSKFIPNSGTA
tara:strand:- start:44090 stop:44653 length:564 start_codon:yes stop_codon:yes gene_type:complete